MALNEYFVLWKTRSSGPYSDPELRALIKRGRISMLATVLSANQELTIDEFLSQRPTNGNPAPEHPESNVYQQEHGSISVKSTASERKLIPARQVVSLRYDPTCHLVLIGYALGLTSIFFMPLVFGSAALCIALLLIYRKKALPGGLLLLIASLFVSIGVAGKRETALANLISLNTVAMDLPDLRAATKPAVVHVVAFNEAREVIATGSGFFVAPHVVVTNFHVVNGANDVVVTLDNGTESSCDEVLSLDIKRDIAILYTRSSGSKFLAVDPQTPSDGERVAVIGSPLGFEGTLSEGIISAVRSDENQIEFIQISAPISPGSSGSPVVNRFGSVVGVATMVAVGGQSINFAVSGAELTRVIETSNQPITR